MRKIYGILAALSLLAATAAAQEEHAFFERTAAQVRVVGLQGGIMGKTIKSAPYSGVEVSETTQMLADGTRIHNESQTQVFRDSEGRMRRETPTEITIWDPVGSSSYLLNPKTKEARKLPMGNVVFSTDRVANGKVFTYTQTLTTAPGTIGMRAPMEEGVHVVATPVDDAKMKTEIETRVKLAKTRADLEARVASGVPMPPATLTTAGTFSSDMVAHKLSLEKANTESLGKQTIEGVTAEGTRQTFTIEAGAIGNDRPIQSVNERWFSPDLQTVMMTRHTDPRMGEEVFKLINVNRAEPAAYLFQVPAGYQVIDPK